MKSVLAFILPPGIFLLLLAGLFIAGDRSLGEADSDWPRISREQRQTLDAQLRQLFAAYQDEAHAASQKAAAAILMTGRDATGAASQGELFAALGEGGLQGLTLEYYDTAGVLNAWTGPGGPDLAPGALNGMHRSYLDEGPINSYLVIIVPVYRNERVTGHVVAKRLFTVNHPVDNRFISSHAAATSFQSIVGDEAGLELQFRVLTPRNDNRASLTGGAEGNTGDAETFIVPLKSVDGRDIVYVLAPAPGRGSYIELIRGEFSRWEGLALSGFLISLIVVAAWRFRKSAGGLIYQSVLLGSLWVLRYLLVALDLPGNSEVGDLFDPGLFASSFGYGAAKSAGDMFFSGALLAITLAVLVRKVVAAEVPPVVSTGGDVRIGAARAVAGVAGFALLIGLLGPLSRGFFAVIQSVVFDSRIDLNDPRMVYPGLTTGSLLFGALLLVFALFLGGMLFILGARRSLCRFIRDGARGRGWIAIAAASVASSLLFDLLHPNPLGTPVQRLAMLTGFIGLSYLAVGWSRQGTTPGPARTFLVVSLSSAAVLVAALDSKVHDHDKVLIEAVVRDIARPESAWMAYVLNESLTTLSEGAAARVLRAGNARATGKLAFGAWAGSILATEGNTCSVTFVDIEGSVVSHFHAGPAPHWSREMPMDEMPRSTRFTSRESRSIRGRTSPWYKGYAPIFTPDSQFAGGVWVGIAPNDAEKILGQDLDLLASPQKFENRRPVRKVLLAEYSDGRLVSGFDDDLSIGRRLPAGTDSGLVEADGRWVSEYFGGDEYETYYLRTTGRTVLGVSLESLDAGWHFYSYSRYILFFTSIFLLGAGLYGLWRATRARPSRPSFKTTLTAAFAVVSLIPVILLAYYNRVSLQQEAERSTDEFLKSETDLVLNEIQGRMGMTVPYELAGYTDETLEEIAGVLNTQVHLYNGAYLIGSSRSELFVAELIDRRLPAGAFAGVCLSGMNFYSEEQTVGSVRYLVGYRPVRAQTGEVIGVVAVPSLSRQGMIETDLARRDVILYGIYILVLAVALVVGTGIANQIARPVRRLTMAARQVATGDLDVRLETGRRDEIGELETAFQGMTSDLKTVQERMVKVERELAWKEMAKQVAHEIKNPLTPMRLSVQHLVSAYQKGGAGFAEVLKSVSSTVLEQIDALSRIASEFSAFARLPERRLDLCAVHEVINEAAGLYHREGVRFATSFVPGEPRVKADREELRRAFINIFRNSVQAAQSDVSISVSTRTEGSILVISITDNGPGMTREILGRLFEPNFSTKTDGMGIGLTIVRKTIEDLNGSVGVESTPGEGTTVRIRLPLADRDDG